MFPFRHSPVLQSQRRCLHLIWSSSPSLGIIWTFTIHTVCPSSKGTLATTPHSIPLHDHPTDQHPSQNSSSRLIVILLPFSSLCPLVKTASAALCPKWCATAIESRTMTVISALYLSWYIKMCYPQNRFLLDHQPFPSSMSRRKWKRRITQGQWVELPSGCNSTASSWMVWAKPLTPWTQSRSPLTAELWIKIASSCIIPATTNTGTVEGRRNTRASFLPKLPRRDMVLFQ